MSIRRRSLHQHGWFHLTNRGVDRQDIFVTDLDRRVFLDEVGTAAEPCGIEIHAYCLMSTHFHLVVNCPEGSLSDFVMTFAKSYAEGFNRRTEREGPVFTGRFRSVPIENNQDSDGDPDDALSTAVRYVHRNPLDLLRVEHLSSYAWSSYACYLDRRRCPDWLHQEAVRSLYADVGRLASFTETALPSDKTPAKGRSFDPYTPTEIIDAVAFAARSTSLQIRNSKRSGTRNDPRTIAAHLCVSLRSAPTVELAGEFGLSTRQGLRQLASRGKKLISVDPSAASLSKRSLDILWASAAAA